MGGCFHGMLQVEALAFQPLLDGSECVRVKCETPENQF